MTAVSYRSSNSVTNGTAGTSVTVNKPSGTVDGDALVAFVSAVGTPTITAPGSPGDWELVESLTDDDSSLTTAVYVRIASSEGASWTWTLGSSARNWGWVGAFIGVDPDNPVYLSEVSLRPDPTYSEITESRDMRRLYVPPYGAAVMASSAVRAATGSATTWAQSAGTERLDTSTNAGSGTDISGSVCEVGNQWWTRSCDTSFVADSDQDAYVALGISLRPYFAPYTGTVGGAGILVEAAFGTGPDDDLDSATWTDIADRGLEPAKVVLTHGRANWAQTAAPCKMALTLIDTAGTFLHPEGTYADHFVENLPLRVWVTGFGAGDYLRGTAFLSSAKPRWGDESLTVMYIDVVASGRLQRMGQNTLSPGSAAYIGFSNSDEVVAYWPFEDESGANRAAAVTANTQPALASGVTFGGDSSSYDGSAALATLSANASISATIPSHAISSYLQWKVAFCLKIPTEPAADTTLLEIAANGSIKLWKIHLVRGTSALHLRAYDSTNTLVLDDADTLTEADYYGDALTYYLEVTTSGANISYSLNAYDMADDLVVGLSGTLSSQTIGVAKSFRVRPAAGLADATFGHLVYTTGAFAPGGTYAGQPAAGYPGERSWTRFKRLCQTFAIPFTFDTYYLDPGVEMGPQPITTLTNLLRECEAAEGAMMHDTGSGCRGDLVLPVVQHRYNRDPSLTLDLDEGHVSDLLPTLDSQGKTNDVTVSRPGGSVARVANTESIAVVGARPATATRNVSDELLIHQAGWLTNLGTAEDMRLPAVAWDLRGSPDLAEQWLACHLSCRIDIDHPPPQYPPDLIQALLEGYTETLSADTWKVSANLSPYGPWRVFEIGHDVYGRLDTRDSACVSVVGAADASFLVASNDGCRWIDSAAFSDQFPFAVWLGKEVVQVDSITGTSSPQTFNVTRAINGVQREWPANTQIRLAAVAVS